jgi:hypothetical protein
MVEHDTLHGGFVGVANVLGLSRAARHHTVHMA